MAISEGLRQQIIARARHRCEYCRLSQASQEATFHMDHVVPRARNGPTILENLALACVSCSLRKGARETATDPESGEDVPLFNPRRDSWSSHFPWSGVRVIALTSVGRATIAALAMNRPLLLAIRREEIVRGWHPQTDEQSQSQ